MNNKFFTRMFFVAALWNFAAGAPGLVAYPSQFKLVFGEGRTPGTSIRRCSSGRLLFPC
jgi:hypothetical protein